MSLYVRATSQACNYLSIRVDIENEIANCKSLHAPSNEVKMLFPLTLGSTCPIGTAHHWKIEDADWKMFPMFNRFPTRGDVSTHSEAEIRSDRDNCRLVIVSNLAGLLLFAVPSVNTERQNIFIDFEIRCLSISWQVQVIWGESLHKHGEIDFRIRPGGSRGKAFAYKSTCEGGRWQRVSSGAGRVWSNTIIKLGDSWNRDSSRAFCRQRAQNKNKKPER